MTPKAKELYLPGLTSSVVVAAVSGAGVVSTMVIFCNYEYICMMKEIV